MTDTTIKKIHSQDSPRGTMGPVYLAAGKRMSLRLWTEEAGGDEKPPRRRDYETVGYVIEGRAELESEGQTVRLETGDSWVVPEGALHTYRILEGPFRAVEATAPPAEFHGRDSARPPQDTARGVAGDSE
jgi:quercetin dioxygenase-like cupin family protein